MNKLILLMLLTLVGCSAFQTKENVAPIDHTYSETVKPLPSLDGVAVQQLPVSPKAIKAVGPNGEPLVGFTVEGADQLRKLRAAAEANTQLATDALDTNRSLINERNSVVQLGRLEEARANYLAQQWKMQADEADKAKRDQRWSEWGNRLLWVVSLFLIK